MQRTKCLEFLRAWTQWGSKFQLQGYKCPETTRASHLKHNVITLRHFLAKFDYYINYSRVPNITVGLNKSVGANFFWK